MHVAHGPARVRSNLRGMFPFGDTFNLALIDIHFVRSLSLSFMLDILIFMSICDCFGKHMLDSNT